MLSDLWRLIRRLLTPAGKSYRDQLALEFYARRLEERLVLNADFALVSPNTLELSNFAAGSMLTARDDATGDRFEFVLDGGVWSGADSPGVLGTGGDTLSVEKGAASSIRIAGPGIDVEFGTLTVPDTGRFELMGVDTVAQQEVTSVRLPMATFDAQSVLLPAVGNDFDTVTVTSVGAIELSDANDLVVEGNLEFPSAAEIRSGNDLTIRSSGGVTGNAQPIRIGVGGILQLEGSGDLLLESEQDLSVGGIETSDGQDQVRIVALGDAGLTLNGRGGYQNVESDSFELGSTNGELRIAQTPLSVGSLTLESVGGGVTLGESVTTSDGTTISAAGGFKPLSVLNGSVRLSEANVTDISIRGADNDVLNVNGPLELDGTLRADLTAVTNAELVARGRLEVVTAGSVTGGFAELVQVGASADVGLVIESENANSTSVGLLATPVVRLMVQPANGSEDAETPIIVTATTAVPVSQDQLIRLTFDGATTTTDFGTGDAAAFEIIIPDGDTSGSVTLTIADDSLVEGQEDVGISGTANGDLTVGDQPSTVTIEDNDFVEIELAETSVDEGSSVDLSFRLRGAGATLQEDLDNILVLASASTGTEAEDASVEAISNFVFPALSEMIMTTITFSAATDNLLERDESFRFELSGPTLGGHVSYRNATISIVDQNDATILVEMGQSVEEGMTLPIQISFRRRRQRPRRTTHRDGRSRGGSRHRIDRRKLWSLGDHRVRSSTGRAVKFRHCPPDERKMTWSSPMRMSSSSCLAGSRRSTTKMRWSRLSMTIGRNSPSMIRWRPKVTRELL